MNGSMATPIGGSMADVKRGRLESVHIKPNYDEKGKIKDHTVTAHHENGDNGKKGVDNWARPEPVEDHPHSLSEAMDVAKAHLSKNEDEAGSSGRMSKGRSMKEALGGL
jgi:hypothetical protein